MWVIGGGDKNNYRLSTTQIVRPGLPTEKGPDMTEDADSHCSTTLAKNNKVIITGGKRMSEPDGSNKTEVYSFDRQEWTTLAKMNERRFQHSCAPVWLNPHPDTSIDGIITGMPNNSSVLGGVVAGGKYSSII